MSLTVSGLVTVVLLAGVAAAQSDDSQQSADQTNMFAGVQGPFEARTLALKYANAQLVANPVQNAVGDLYISADGRNNTLLLVGTAEALQAAEQLVQSLDVAPPATDDEVRVFAIKHAFDLPRLTSTIDTVLNRRRGGPDPSTAVMLSPDVNSRQIIARGAAQALDSLGVLLAALDVPPAESAASAEMRVRLVWLVGGPGERRAAPPDLKDVLTELEAIGIDGLGLAAQTIVRTRAGEKFHTRFVADLDTPWLMEFAGTAEVDAGPARLLEIQIRGQETEGPGHTSIETVMTSTSGHFVVLGATPIGPLDSVFVIQVTDID